jgi:hypothetical protein
MMAGHNHGTHAFKKSQTRGGLGTKQHDAEGRTLPPKAKMDTKIM